MAAKFELKQTKSGKFAFNLKATNGQVILTSQQYKEKSSAQTALNRSRKTPATMPTSRATPPAATNPILC